MKKLLIQKKFNYNKIKLDRLSITFIHYILVTDLL